MEDAEAWIAAEEGELNCLVFTFDESEIGGRVVEENENEPDKREVDGRAIDEKDVGQGKTEEIEKCKEEVRRDSESGIKTPGAKMGISTMEDLPTELRRDILQKLDLTDVKSMRLTSMLWASLGEEYLISPNFTMYPYRDDMSRLMSIAQNSKFAHRIESLTINIGESHEYSLRHNIWAQTYTLDQDVRSLLNLEAWDAYQRHKPLSEKNVSRCCDRLLLGNVLPNLPNLHSISVSLHNCPFQDQDLYPDLLRTVWKMPTSRLSPLEETMDRFTNIIQAILDSSSEHRIDTFSHDDLPLGFFSQREEFIPLLNKVLPTVKSLTVGFTEELNCLSPTDRELNYQNLATCLRIPTNLQKLGLDFHRGHKVDVTTLLNSLQAGGDSPFPHLQDLTLEGIKTKENDLGSFLVRLKGLKRLRLGGDGFHEWHKPPIGGVRLMEGGFRGLFAKIKKEMVLLENFELMGDFVAVESGETWILTVPDSVENLGEYVID